MEAEQGIGLREVWAYFTQKYALIKREQGQVLAIFCIVCAAGFLYLVFGERSYEARARVVPYRGSASMSGLSGLAGLAGVRLPSIGLDVTITGDLYPEIGKSTGYRIAVANAELPFALKGTRTSIERYLADSGSVSFRNMVLAPLRWVSSALKGDRVNPMEGAGPYPSEITDEQLAAVRFLEERLTVSYDRRTSVITITGRLDDPYAAAALVEAAQRELLRRITEVEVRKATEQLEFVRTQHASAKARFEDAQLALARFTERNRSGLSAALRVESQRLESAYELTFGVYQQLSQELEQANLRRNQDTPAFTVIEEPVVPPKASSPRGGVVLPVSLLLGLVAGVAVPLLRGELRELRQSAGG